MRTGFPKRNKYCIQLPIGTERNALRNAIKKKNIKSSMKSYDKKTLAKASKTQ